MSSSAGSKLRAFLNNPVIAVVQASSILHCINEYAFGITTCAGPSMLPTFNMAGDVVFVDKLSPRRGNVQRGDVVIANTPQNAKQMVCKRVIAMEGETLLVHSRSWFGGRLESVPKGHVWLEGDNPSNSTDSRTYGPVPLAMVRGRVFLKAWPLTELSLVPRESPENASLVVVVGDGTDEGGGEGIGIAAPEWKTR